MRLLDIATVSTPTAQVKAAAAPAHPRKRKPSMMRLGLYIGLI